ncbi:peptide/nickel transport system ATP-binding protein [Cohnella sp. OV330]|uniref:ABC transporter ATP-binding protein n=1 Tax=Cohnella sp. OV330 TaxID=1855288 RepID=UPI0008F3C684|nr:ABC transporter ATP-binding protein [Cohnella sp. OV330]SFB50043.1 peptide/nickel transport system ATP-binding protein [Cohnella sp. OV330]
MQSLLEIEQLSVGFRTKRGFLQALHDVSLTIAPGETVCLVGESGSGKTVASKAVMRLVDYENGQIEGGRIALNGVDLTALTQGELRSLRGKRIAMIFQEPMAAFDPVYTIGYQIVETILRHERKTKAEAKAHAASLLARVGIPEPELRMKQYPGELSGGMLQRAMIALALSCGPELLIADEPTTALDVTIQAQILHLLQELKAEFGMSILLITHDLGIAAQIADRIVVMYAGRIVEQATVAELFAQPHHPYTSGLLRSVATLDTEKGDRLYAIAGSIPSLSKLPEGCVFHPRCPHATDRCRASAPPLVKRGGREAACWHADALLQDGALSAREAQGEATDRGESAGAALWPDRGVSSVVAPEHGESAVVVPNRGLTAHEPPAPETVRVLLEEGKENGTTQAEQAKTGSVELFKVEDVCKYYPIKRGFPGRSRTFVRAVDGVSFSIREGETLGLVGESGSGKSTLGRLLLQLEPVTSGRVLFEGEDLTRLGASRLRQTRRHMQMIFQDPYGSLDPRWNVGDLVGEPLAVHHGLAGKEKKQRVEELLAAVGLDHGILSRHPHEFSGGQRQRIGIARAIALHPKFVLADEAVSALDVSVQAQVVNLMQDLQQKLGLTYLFIAHGLHVVRHISDRIAVMYLGRIVEIAPSRELFRRPAHPYTRALIDSIPHPDPRLRTEPAAIRGEIPSPARPPAGCRFHTRCPLATDRCRSVSPDLLPLDGDRSVACHYPLQ